MCHSYNKHFLLTLTLLSTGIVSFAQNSNKENAPYSRYGLGEQRNGANTVLKGMASISSAYANSFNVNTDNPASYASLKLTTYEAGAEGSMRNIQAGGRSYGTGTATLSYLTVGIPIGKYAGVALGLRPYTRVFYRMNDSTELDGIGPAIRNYSGEGSTNYGFIGVAGTYGGFSIGANIGYLFGTIRNSSLIQKLYDTVNTYNADFSRYTKVGGLHYKLGIMYSTALTKTMNLRVGGTATLNQNVNAWRDEYAISFRNTGNGSVADTAIRLQEVKGKIALPLSYSFGAQLAGGDNWMVGVDYSAAQWSQYRSYDLADSVDNAYKMAIGGEYTPNATSLYNYLQRVTYRIGFYYGKDYVKLRNTDINYYALTLGGSLPFKRSADRLHLGLELGKRGTQTNGLISENFFKFSIGISLNDRWFVKKTYD